MAIDQSARLNAQATRNARACDEMEGDKTTVAYFDAVAAKRYHDHPWMPGYFGYDKFPNKTVLEIGIGQGTDLATFGQGGAICHGVDITDNHLNLTSRNFSLRGLNVDLRKADATALPFGNETFDKVYSMGVLHHIPEITQIMSKIRRVLKPWGSVMLAHYYTWSAFHIFQKIMANGIRNGWLISKGYDGLLATIEDGADGVIVKPYVRLYSKASMRSILQGFNVEGLSVHHLLDTHFWPPFLQRAFKPYLCSMESSLGWYVCARARLSAPNMHH